MCQTIFSKTMVKTLTVGILLGRMVLIRFVQFLRLEYWRLVWTLVCANVSDLAICSPTNLERLNHIGVLIHWIVNLLFIQRFINPSMNINPHSQTFQLDDCLKLTDSIRCPVCFMVMLCYFALNYSIVLLWLRQCGQVRSISEVILLLLPVNKHK